tara:strand:+ start:1472 stop:1639 length:168 start_codon:yes stop_codon:yes gene_type:complete
MLHLTQKEINYLTEILEYQLENWGIEEYDKEEEAHEWDTYFTAFRILKQLNNLNQ